MDDRRDDATEDSLKDFQRQVRPGLADGRCGHTKTEQVGEIRQRGVAVEDLHDEDMHDPNRIKRVGAPGMSG